MNPSSFTLTQKTLAWSVHLFTSSGICSAFMAILAVAAHNWVEAFWWLSLCLVIDGIDGTFARMFRVKEVLPTMDGKTIDYIIDFTTYAIIPAYFFYEAAMVPKPLNLTLTLIILLVSTLYYGKTGMVSDDNYFIGFPVLWNVVVFYLYFVVPLSPWAVVATIIFFSVIHFVPIKFAYPSRASRFFWPTLAMSLIGLGSLIFILINHPVSQLYRWIAMIPIVYFGILAFFNTYIEKKSISKYL